MKKLVFLFLLFSITSCGGLMDRIYSDLEAEDRRKSNQARDRDQFSRFRNNKAPSRNTLRSNNSRSQSFLAPAIKRDYRPTNTIKKRYTARDLNDNSDDGSLWAGKGKENYLFSINKAKKNGDIILINVFNKLKKDISLELKRAFPTKKVLPKKDEEGKTAETKPAAPQPTGFNKKEEEKEESLGTNKVHDKISSVVVEEINKDHLLLRGQKYLLYKNRKRLVEVQALVARRDITESDTVNSDTILESSVEILR